MSAILDALGYVGDSLDKPGRAVRGLLGGRPEEALAAIPFSDAMGLTNQENRVGGSELLRQMGMDPGDGLGGTLAGIGVEMATDPLMFAGAGIGGLLGRRAGAAAMARGPRYETTADDLARIMGGTADDIPAGAYPPTPRVNMDGSPGVFELQDMRPASAMETRIPALMDDLPEFTFDGARIGRDGVILDGPTRGQIPFDLADHNFAFRRSVASTPAPTPGATTANLGRASEGEDLAQFHLRKILGSPSAPDLLREVPPNATMLGAGAEGVALRTPAGDVLRIGQMPGSELGRGRPISDDIVQATRAVDYRGPLHNGAESVMRAERTPLASHVNDPNVLNQGRMEDLTSRLLGQNIDFWDNHIGNAGMVGGRAKVIDPGAVMLAGESTLPVSYQAVARGAPGASPLMEQLIRLGGGDEAVRAAIDAGRADPGMTWTLARLGGMGGAGVGAASRFQE